MQDVSDGGARPKGLSGPKQSEERGASEHSCRLLEPSRQRERATQPAAAVIGHPASAPASHQHPSAFIAIAVQSLFLVTTTVQSSPVQSAQASSMRRPEALSRHRQPARVLFTPHASASPQHGRPTSRRPPSRPDWRLHKRAPLNWPRPGAPATSLTCESAGQE